MITLSEHHVRPVRFLRVAIACAVAVAVLLTGAAAASAMSIKFKVPTKPGIHVAAMRFSSKARPKIRVLGTTKKLTVAQGYVVGLRKSKRRNQWIGFFASVDVKTTGRASMMGPGPFLRIDTNVPGTMIASGDPDWVDPIAKFDPATGRWFVVAAHYPTTGYFPAADKKGKAFLNDTYKGFLGTGTGSFYFGITGDAPANQFAVTVALSGNGSGIVNDQAGSYVMNCSIVDGVATATLCSATYPLGATATEVANTTSNDSSFGGWTGDCSGAGTCQLTSNVAKEFTVGASFSKGGLGGTFVSSLISAIELHVTGSFGFSSVAAPFNSFLFSAPTGVTAVNFLCPTQMPTGSITTFQGLSSIQCGGGSFGIGEAIAFNMQTSVAASGYQIFYARVSHDGGLTWSDPLTIASPD